MSGVRKCIVSPNHHFYKYCPQCGRDNPEETWRFLFCSENCRDVYRVFEAFAEKKIDAVTAEQRLNELTVPRDEYLQPSLRDNLRDIREAAAKSHQAAKKTESEKTTADKTVENKPKRKPRKKKEATAD